MSCKMHKIVIELLFRTVRNKNETREQMLTGVKRAKILRYLKLLNLAVFCEG